MPGPDLVGSNPFSVSSFGHEVIYNGPVGEGQNGWGSSDYGFHVNPAYRLQADTPLGALHEAQELARNGSDDLGVRFDFERRAFEAGPIESAIRGNDHVTLQDVRHSYSREGSLGVVSANGSAALITVPNTEDPYMGRLKFQFLDDLSKVSADQLYQFTYDMTPPRKIGKVESVVCDVLKGIDNAGYRVEQWLAKLASRF